MHNFKTEKTNFNFNSDLSGNVYIKNENNEEIEVNGGCLIEFVGNYLRGEMISYMEKFDILDFVNFLSKSKSKEIL